MKTTKQHFELFKRECKKWIKLFGLIDYRIEYFNSEEANGSRGETRDYDDLMAVDIIFPKELNDETNIEKIKMAAFHEICEIMLMRLRKMADNYYNFYRVNQEVHIIIRRLENFIFKTN